MPSRLIPLFELLTTIDRSRRELIDRDLDLSTILQAAVLEAAVKTGGAPVPLSQLIELTAMPRETVRRKVRILAQRGLLPLTRRGQVATDSELLQEFADSPAVSELQSVTSAAVREFVQSIRR
ncbi:MAG TPA: hypothetical protein VEC14_10745 [Reyranellaceae bacterium]|nr:hypothetical protein [Reyranellaceae bacterium]